MLEDLHGASIYNILSSNIINLVQYLASIVLNKNGSKLKNNAIITDLIMVGFTIIIPILLLKFKIELNLSIVPLFILLYTLFRYLNNNAHKVYLKKEDIKMEEEIETERRIEKRSKRKTVRYAIILISSGILLYIVGELLGNTLENLCNLFNIQEVIIGVLLGFITSIPELITFFESQKHHKKGQDEMLGVIEATSNLLTSNVVNLFIIQTIGIIILNI